MENKNPNSMTLAEHAEAWWQEQGFIVPTKNSLAYQKMYEKWHEFAFKGIGD